MNPREPLSPEEQALAQRLRSWSSDGPSPSLDALVLAQARAVEPAVRTRRARRPWLLSLASAAALVLTVGVVWRTIESPDPNSLIEAPARTPATVPAMQSTGKPTLDRVEVSGSRITSPTQGTDVDVDDAEAATLRSDAPAADALLERDDASIAPQDAQPPTGAATRSRGAPEGVSPPAPRVAEPLMDSMPAPAPVTVPSAPPPAPPPPPPPLSASEEQAGRAGAARQRRESRPAMESEMALPPQEAREQTVRGNDAASTPSLAFDNEIERIRALVRDKQIVAALVAIAQLRRQYPDATLPADLLAIENDARMQR